MPTVRFTATIQKFSNKGDKTGWTYVEIPSDIAELLAPGTKRSFRVKGKLDAYAIKGVALFPTGTGAFGLPLNATMRKNIGKKQGAMLELSLSPDKAAYQFNEDFMACLQDEPDSLQFFRSLTPSHQKYFNNWIESAKTDQTRTKRIASTLNALGRKQPFGEMIRSLSSKKAG